MKARHIVLATALLGGVLLSNAVAAPAAAAPKFAAPAPDRIVAPSGLPRSHEGATVMLSLTIDAAGRPHDIKIVSRGDQELAPSLVSAVSQWQFTPARKDGAPVPAKVILPLELVES